MTRETVEKILMELGIPVKVKGFRYIPDAVLLLDDGWDKAAMEKVYMKIAMVHGDKFQNVERAIRHALTMARKSGRDNLVRQYLGEHPQNKASLYFLYYSLASQEKGGGAA